MLLAHLVLDGQPTLVSHLYDRSWLERQIGETFPALNACYTKVCAEVEVSLELSLGHSHFEGPSSCDRRYVVDLSCLNLATGGCFIGDLPASHRDFQAGHEMSTLLDMALDRDRVVAGVEGTGQRRQFLNADR